MNIQIAKTNGFRETSTLFLLLIVIILISFPLSLYGMNWSDTSQIFHFGNRILHGDFPYKDFDYQTGFIGIVIDAFFQKILGENYLSSLIARLLVKISTLFFFYLSCRQFTSRLISFSVSSGWLFMHPVLYRGGNDNYVTLFLSITIFFLILGLNKLTKKASFIYLTTAGFFLALVMAARQSNGTICIGVTLAVLVVYIWRNIKKENYLLSVLAPFLIGIILGLGLIVGVLLWNNSLSQALYHLFIGASEKKYISTFSSLIDALSGGAIYYNSSIAQILIYLVFPLLLCLLAFLIIIKPEELVFNQNFNPPGFITTSFNRKCNYVRQIIIRFLNKYRLKFTIVIIILLIVSALLGKIFLGENNIISYDIPRTFFSLALIASCIFPEKSKQFFGLPYPIFPLLIALTLGTTWAMQMSWPGRPYTDDDVLIFSAILTIIMSTKISPSWKKGLALAFLFITASVFSGYVVRDSIGVEAKYYISGFYQNTRYPLEHPMTKFVKVTKEKVQAFSMLQQNIKPGDSCFIYGSASVLYTLLDCQNPTHIDITNSDALTLKIAREAVSVLKANPPKWIVDTGKGGFYIPDIYDGSPNFYGAFNQLSPKELHTGLQSLIGDYQLVTTVKARFTKGEKLETRDQDKVFRFRLYKHSANKAD
ncbi:MULTISPECIES: hypothetical protein [Nostoc]|uniref:Glycosyltransferase RgtA/B/C/D-like domain-containing protein n=1 Tax=Nostoc paludosum FACHB-159 TaxID=2692908 RepID=A0ABR8K850_9NOSO|nr:MULTISPECIES: hypothetical protein [Nostoc]MBD2678185.1 hypothetical protein [Nostoc sp. FACHB-857]MBD2734445.1 hypothetical protein [Nostoc paludosum FACHB-159]